MSKRLAVLSAASALLGALCSGPARAQTSAVFQVAPSSADAALEAHAFDAPRASYLAAARASYLDKTGRTPLPEPAFREPEASAFAPDIAALKTLAAQAAFIEAGRGAQTLPDYADMVVLVASRLGVKPPESALAVYRDR
ncbi:MAG TPA: hypothetical protein VH309_01510, partial [Elusimicrobiota bacterium]|nr:hypothetical protein [Elusimicrobiota bacterium]